MSWTTVCNTSDLIPGTGVCALVGNEQVAIFKLRKDNAVYAISNFDPIGKANVMSRGLTGSIGESIVVASPLYKQHFDLVTGQCLEDDEVSVKTYEVKLDGDAVQVKAA